MKECFKMIIKLFVRIVSPCLRLALCLFLAGASVFIPASASASASAKKAVIPQSVADELERSHFAVFALTASGDTLIDIQADKMLVPASNMKLITTGLALDALGEDFRYETKIAWSGSIENGILDGDLYIVGGGDPTLAADDSIAVPTPLIFEQWYQMIYNAGITGINGNIIGDDRYFGPMAEHPTWQWDDCGTYYGTGISGLTFFENIQTFNVTAGQFPGDDIVIYPSYPDCPWMDYRYDCSTGEAGTGDRLYFYTSSLAPAGEMRGTFAVDRNTKIVECSNKFPAYTCASYFERYLSEKGVECTGGAADLHYFRPESVNSESVSSEGISSEGVSSEGIRQEGGSGPYDSLTVAGSTFSPVLGRIAFETNYESNNLYAETLFNTLGRKLSGSGTYDASSIAAVRLLEDMGIDCREAVIEDGSGLSRHNLLSPSFICDFLAAMKSSDAFGAFWKSLPSPGCNGTLTYAMRDYAPEIAGKVRMKSGSMSGVKCFSGYILSPTGSPEDAAVFSVMINNSDLSQARMQKIADKIISLIVAAVQVSRQP